MHLGDVYYSGTESRKFASGSSMLAEESRAAVGRGELESRGSSGGFGYFKVALPALGQASSYSPGELALAARRPRHGVRRSRHGHEQVAWLNLVIEESRSEPRQAEEAGAVLAPAAVLAAGRRGTEAAESAAAPSSTRRPITPAWSWVASISAVIFQIPPIPAVCSLRGRCLGNDGITRGVAQKRDVKQSPTKRRSANSC